MFSAGCKDKKKPWVNAKAEHGPSFATVAAYAPLLESGSGPTAKRVALLAADRITRAVKLAKDAELAKYSSVDDQQKQPRLALQSLLASIDLYCHRIPTISKDDEVIASCAKGIKGIDPILDIYKRRAEKEAPGVGIPGTLAGWATDDAKKRAEPLAKLAKEGGDDDKLAALWNDPNATFDSLDAACKERMAKQKSERAGAAGAGGDPLGAGGDPSAAGALPSSAPSGSAPESTKSAEDEELENIKFDAARETVDRCISILQFSLAEKILGACVDQGDSKCFHERSCKIVAPLKKAMDPPPVTAGNLAFGRRRDEGLPKALEPRAKKFVDQCASYIHTGYPF